MTGASLWKTLSCVAVAAVAAALSGCGDNLAGAPDAAPRPDAISPPDATPALPDHLLIANSSGDDIVRFEQQTGAFIDVFVAADAGLDHPDSMLLRDGLLYVSTGADEQSSAIARFDAETGEPVDTFASGDGMHRPYGFAFGPDGLLYVASFLSDQILRYDGETGAFVDVFAQGDAQPGGLNGPDIIIFDDDGMLYVTTQGSVAVDGEPTFPGLPSEVLRYDPMTGVGEVFAEQPVPLPDSFGFVSLLGLAFGPDCDGGACDLFVSDFANGIRRYDADGDLLATINTNYTGTDPSENFIGGLDFGADNALFTVGFDNVDGRGAPGSVLRYDGDTGDPLPGPDLTGALLVDTSERLVRPIGILAVPGQ